MKNNCKIFVTGANSLLGVNTILELLNQGYKVKGLLRDTNKFIDYRHENLELIEGDILDRNLIFKSMLDCKYTIHIAAVTDSNLLHYIDYEKVNVEGTKNIIDSAIQNKLSRVIYVSTANVFGYGSLDCLGNESKQMMSPYLNANYSKSKKVAHDYVLTKQNEIEVVIVSPSFMIGPYDSKPSSGKIILMGLKNRIILCPPGGKSFVCVKDVSTGIVRALERGVSGESYLLSNENLSFKEFFKLLRKQTNSKHVIVPIPKILLLIIGYLGDFVRLFGINTQYCIQNMKILCTKNYYSNNKAKFYLGVNFNPIEKGISDSILWFLNNSMV